MYVLAAVYEKQVFYRILYLDNVYKAQFTVGMKYLCCYTFPRHCIQCQGILENDMDYFRLSEMSRL